MQEPGELIYPRDGRKASSPADPGNTPATMWGNCQGGVFE